MDPRVKLKCVQLLSIPEKVESRNAITAFRFLKRNFVSYFITNIYTNINNGGVCMRKLAPEPVSLRDENLVSYLVYIMTFVIS